VDYSASTILANRGDTTVALYIGSNVGYVNGYEVQLDVAPFIIGSRTLVPLRFISESLGAVVDWNQEQQTVYVGLTTPMAPAPQSRPPEYPQAWPPPSGWLQRYGPPPQGWHGEGGGYRNPGSGRYPRQTPTPYRPRPRPYPTFRPPHPIVTPTPTRIYTPRPYPTFRPPRQLPTVRPRPIPYRTIPPRLRPTPTPTP